VNSGDLLNLLREEKEGYLSGEDLSNQLGVSRTAVWKQIHLLEESGYRIAAVPHLGYRLLESPDRLLPDEIRAGLKTKILGQRTVCFQETTSTNDRALELAAAGVPEGTLVAAESQSRGRGRYQRSWQSKANANLLFSLVLRPPWTYEKTPLITLLLAVAVARAVREHTGLAPRIKWPNDLLIEGAKVCGILTEMRTSADQIHFLVGGIGLNVNAAPGGALRTRASSLAALLGKPVVRLPLLQRILEAIEDDYLEAREHGFERMLAQWPLLSATPLGTPLRLEIQGGEKAEGTAMGLDEAGALLVRLETGITRRFASGEIQFQIVS
jgi:BirA family transcriptional regulator, biotin operon repressor / biotin---[acetyl-CoA-carboxylase] ligase